MLSLSTRRPTVSFELDGEVVEVPVTFTRAEMVAIAGVDAEDATAQLGWFSEFLRAYVGDRVDEMGDDVIVAIMGEWAAAREGVGEPLMGEPSPSRG